MNTCSEREVEILLKIAKCLYDNSFDHGLPHVERVYKWAEKIAESESIPINMSALKLVVYLHDIGRFVGEPHAYYSAVVADEMLKEALCSSAFIEEVTTAILAHSFSYFRKLEKRAVNELGKILSDADKLDALGVVGFLRVFIYGERHGRTLRESIEHFYDKILKLHELMHYEYSKKIAQVLTERVKILLKMLEDEVGSLNEKTY